MLDITAHIYSLSFEDIFGLFIFVKPITSKVWKFICYILRLNVRIKLLECKFCCIIIFLLEVGTSRESSFNSITLDQLYELVIINVYYKLILKRINFITYHLQLFDVHIRSCQQFLVLHLLDLDPIPAMKFEIGFISSTDKTQ